MPVTVQCGDQTKQLSLLVVRGHGHWLHQLKLNWKELYHVNQSPSQSLLDRRAAVFKDDLGSLRGVAATILVDEDSRPRYFRPRPVPYALRPKVEAELD